MEALDFDYSLERLYYSISVYIYVRSLYIALYYIYLGVLAELIDVAEFPESVADWCSCAAWRLAATAPAIAAIIYLPFLKHMVSKITNHSMKS